MAGRYPRDLDRAGQEHVAPLTPMKGRILRQQWRKHDLKKTVGLVVILASVAGTYYERTGELYDLLKVLPGDESGFKLLAPDPWPIIAGPNLIAIRGTSKAEKVSLVSNGKSIGGTTVVNGRWELRVKGNEVTGRPLTIREYWPFAVSVHRLGQVQAAPVPRESLVTVDSPANGEQVQLGPVVFSGTAKPGRKILVYVDDQLIGRTQAGKYGVWRAYKLIDTPGKREVVAKDLLTGEETLISHVQFGSED